MEVSLENGERGRSLAGWARKEKKAVGAETEDGREDGKAMEMEMVGRARWMDRLEGGREGGRVGKERRCELANSLLPVLLSHFLVMSSPP